MQITMHKRRYINTIWNFYLERNTIVLISPEDLQDKRVAFSLIEIAKSNYEKE